MAKILLADDEPDVLKIVRFRLASKGHVVISAINGQEAWDLAQTQCPDLLILDYRMPKLDGLEVCRKVRACESLKGVPVLILSASLGGITASDLDVAGVTAWVVKPFDPDELLRKVEKLIEERREAR